MRWPIKLMGDYKYIELGPDQFAAVPEEDYELIKDYRWHLEEAGCAATVLPGGEVIEMGRLIMRLKNPERLISPAPWNDSRN